MRTIINHTLETLRKLVVEDLEAVEVDLTHDNGTSTIDDEVVAGGGDEWFWTQRRRSGNWVSVHIGYNDDDELVILDP